MVSWAVDGMDVFAVEDAARKAAEGVRAGTGPHFLEMRTYRFRAHSMYEADRYRDKAEIEHWKERDPVEGLARQLREAKELTDKARTAMEDRLAAEIDHAVEAADQAPEEPVEDLLKYVTSPEASRP
jgi:pyruvate dehydrogenase E1 component alpha subunit